MIKARHILVTGGGGKLGKALGTFGCNALDRRALDITSPTQIVAAIETHAPSLIINCAAYTAVDQAEDDVEAAFAVNRDGAAHLADACAEARIPLVQISTDCVFGDGTPDRPATEDDRPDPLSVYGQSKFDGEEAVRTSAGRTAILRVSWLFDDGPDTFIGKMLALGAKHDSLKIVDDAYGRPTHVRDLAPLIMALAGRMMDGMPTPPILHIGPQEPVSRHQWAEVLFGASRKLGGPAPELTPCSSETFSEPARRPRGRILDVSAGNALLGRMPDWKGACHRAVAKNLALAKT